MQEEGGGKLDEEISSPCDCRTFHSASVQRHRPGYRCAGTLGASEFAGQERGGSSNIFKVGSGGRKMTVGYAIVRYGAPSDATVTFESENGAVL